jgi:hypothetical protein
MIRETYDQKKKDHLIKLYTYISYNWQGISNQVNLKDRETQEAGAIESKVNQVISTCFKNKGKVYPKLDDFFH